MFFFGFFSFDAGEILFREGGEVERSVPVHVTTESLSELLRPAVVSSLCVVLLS